VNDISADTVLQAIETLGADDATEDLLAAQFAALVGNDLDACFPPRVPSTFSEHCLSMASKVQRIRAEVELS